MTVQKFAQLASRAIVSIEFHLGLCYYLIGNGKFPIESEGKTYETKKRRPDGSDPGVRGGFLSEKPEVALHE